MYSDVDFRSTDTLLIPLIFLKKNEPVCRKKDLFEVFAAFRQRLEASRTRSYVPAKYDKITLKRIQNMTKSH